MKHKPGYFYVETYDPELEKFAPQKGVRTGPYTQFGLRKAIRKLRELGYPCNYSSGWGGDGDPAVSIWRE